jgi:hypothetical protein
MWRIGRAPNSITIYSYIQQDATSHSLFITGNCSTCFGWYFHRIIRSAYNCIYSIWYLSHCYCYLALSWKSWNRFECAVGGVRHPYGQHSFVDILCCIHTLCPQKTNNATLFYRGTCIQGRRHLVTTATSVVMRIPIVERQNKTR